MNRKLLPGLLMLLAAVSRVSATAFDDANKQFSDGDFPAAAASYEKIIADGGPDAAVFYNLGNSYQKLGRHGPAILAYERARLITPRDPDLSANLALARKAATAFDESGMNPRVEAVTGYLSRNEWSWLVAAGALALGGLSLARGVVDFKVRWMRQSGAVIAVVAGVGILAGSAALYLRRADGGRGIVLSDNAVVRLSPFEKAESLGTAGAGRVVRLGERNGDFRYAEVPGTNLRGWLASHDVDAVIPVDSGR